ncbi:MAG: hypothetical protein QOK15_2789 [Nocardioidaceae bacterium]|nr:hypothetical protein [Nocardioidaceae bacterium]
MARGYDADLVEALRHVPIAPLEKGFGGPRHLSPVTASTLTGARTHERGGWLGSPRAALRESSLRHNLESMARYCASHGVELYPHAKTTMAPQLVAAQLDGGATGITVATATQARVFRSFGVVDVLIANEVTDPASVAWLAGVPSHEPDLTVSCYVDSLQGVELLDAAPRHGGAASPLPVLVELGHDGGRAGARTREAARAVADAVSRSSHLTLAGVAGYEGSLLAPTAEATVAAARAFAEELARFAAELLGSGQLDDRPMVTAGGSAYFDAVVDVLAGQPWRLVLRSGCYLTHDHGLYSTVTPVARNRSGPSLVPALHVWGPVLSRPDASTVIVGTGRRDVSSDAGAPVPVRGLGTAGPVDVEGAQVERVFDQHLVLRVPQGCDLAPGDEVELGISHPCTTFDKWRWLPVLDDDGVIVDVVRTLF